MNKIRLKGLRSIEIVGEDPKEEKEYVIAIKTEVESITKDIKDPANPILTYNMTYLSTELINEVGGKELKVREDIGKYSPSQIQRFAINDSLALFVNDKEEMEKQYEVLMSKNIRMFNLMKELGLNPIETCDKIVSWLDSKRN